MMACDLVDGPCDELNEVDDASDEEFDWMDLVGGVVHGWLGENELINVDR